MANDFPEMNNKLNGITGGKISVDNSDLKETVELLDEIPAKAEKADKAVRKIGNQSMKGKTFRKAVKLDDGGEQSDGSLPTEEKLKATQSLLGAVKKDMDGVSQSVAKTTDAMSAMSTQTDVVAKSIRGVGESAKMALDKSSIHEWVESVKASEPSTVSAIDKIRAKVNELSDEFIRLDTTDEKNWGRFDALHDALENLRAELKEVEAEFGTMKEKISEAQTEANTSGALQGTKEEVKELDALLDDALKKMGEIESGYGSETITNFEEALRELHEAEDNGNPILLDKAEFEEAIPVLEQLIEYLEKVGEAVRDNIQEGMANGADTSGLQNLFSEIEREYQLVADAYDEARMHLNEYRAEETARAEQSSERKALEIAKEHKEVDTETNKKPTGEKGYGTIDLERPVDSIEELEMRIRRVKGDIESMREEARGGDSPLSLEELAASIKEAETELKKYEAIYKFVFGEEKKEKKPESPTGGENGESPCEKGKKIEDCTENVKSAFERMGEFMHSAIGRMSGIFSMLGKAANVAFNGIKTGIGTLVTGMRAGLSAMGSVVKGTFTALANGAKMAAAGLAHLAQAGFERLKSAASAVGHGISALAQGGFNLLKAGVDRAKHGVQDLISKFHNLGGSTSKKLMKSLMSIRSILKRRVKRTFISAIFNQAKEGLQEFAKYNDAFNKAMSNIKNASKTAAGNLSVTLGNLLILIEPILTKIINLISNVLTYINAFFSLLSGGTGTVTVAKQATDDYAKSLNKAGNSANKALSKFDELNVIGQENNNNDSKIEYEEVPIGTALGDMSDLLTQIADSVKNGEWFKAGESIGTLIDSVISTMDEKILELRPKAEKWATDIATLLNGVVSGVNFENAGKTIGDGLNLIVGTFNKFLTTFDFKALGTKISDGINGLVNTVEWDSVGQLLANRINALWHLLEGLVTNLDWDKLGNSLGEMFRNFFENIDFDSWATFVTNGIQGIATALYNAVTKANLPAVAVKFGEAVNKIITGIDWADLGTKASGLFNEAMNTFKAFIETIRFDEAGKSIGKFLKTALVGDENGKGGIDFNGISDTLHKLFGGALDVLIGVAEEFPFNTLVDKLTTALTKFIRDIDWDKVRFVLGVYINYAISAFQKLVTNVPWAELTKDLLDSLNKLITDIDWEGLGDSISGFINVLIECFHELVNSQTIRNLATNLGTTINSVLININWSKLGTDIGAGVMELVYAFADLLKQIKMRDLGKNLATLVNNIFDPDKGGVNFSEVGEKVGEGINSIVELFDGMLTGENKIDFDKIAKNLGSGIRTLIKKIDFVKLGVVVKEGIKGLANTFGTLMTEVFKPDEDGKTLGERLAEGINNLFMTNGVLDTGLFTGLGHSIAAGIRHLLVNIAGFIRKVNWLEAIEGVTNFIASAIDEVFSMDNGGKTIANHFSDALNSVFMDESGMLNTSIFEKVGSRIGEGIRKILSELGKFVKETEWSSAISGVFTFLSNTFTEVFADNVDGQAKNLGEVFAEAFNGIFIKKATGDFDEQAFSNIGKSIGDIIMSVIENIDSFLTDIKWEKVGAAIKETLTSIPFEDIIGKVIQLIKDAIIGAAHLLSQITNAIISVIFQIDWLDIAGKLLSALWDALVATASSIGGSVLNLLKTIVGIEDETRWDVDMGALTRGDQTMLLKWGVDEDFAWDADSVYDTMERYSYSFINALKHGFESEEFKKEIEQMMQKGVSEQLLDAMGRSLDGVDPDRGALLVHKIYTMIANGVDPEKLATVLRNATSGDELYEMLIEGLSGEDTPEKLQVAFEKIYREIADTAFDTFNDVSDQYKDRRAELDWQLLALDYDSLVNAADGGIENLIAKIKEQGYKYSDEFYEALGEIFSGNSNEGEKIDLDFGWLETSLGMDLSGAFESAINGNSSTSAKNAITFALQLLALGINEDIVSALDLTDFDNTIGDWMKKSGASMLDVVAILLHESGMEIEEISRVLGVDAGEIIGKTLPEAVEKTFSEAIKNVEAKTGETVQAMDISGDASKLEEQAKEGASGVPEGAQEALTEGEKPTEEATGKLTSVVSEKFEKLPEEVKPYANELLEYITAAITEGQGNVLQTIQEMANGIVKNVEDTLSGTKGAEITKAFLEGMQKGVVDNEEPVKTQTSTSVQAIANALGEIFSTEEGKAYAINFMNGLSAGLDRESNGSIISIAKDDGRLITDALESYLNWGSGYDIGYNIMLGLANGLTSNKKAVHDIAYAVATDLVNTMTTVLKIHSPSEVFEGIGDYTMQGLQVGLEGQEDSVLNSISNIASSISEEMQDKTNLGYTFDGVTSGLQSVVESLSDVASQFVAVAQAIKGMGGLEIPAIAEGRTIPYSTRIMENADDLNTILSDVTAKIGETNDEQMALLVEQNTLLRQLLEKSFTVNVSPSAAWGRHNAQSMQMYSKLTGG